jgi:rhodanese-related sulfurtransferase
LTRVLRAPTALGLIALVAGILAIALPGDSGHQAGDARLDQLITSGRESMAAESLATRIMAGGSREMTVIDLRNESAFDVYHIPGAVRMRDAELDRSSLPANRAIVLYDSGGTRAARVWLLLKAQGYQQVYILEGGLAAWNVNVMHPSIPLGNGREGGEAAAARIEMSRFFGGTPVVNADRPANRRSRITSKAPMTLPLPSDSTVRPSAIGVRGCLY